MLEDLFLGVNTSNGTKTWLDAALLKIMEFDLNFHLILDAPLHFCQKLHVWPLIAPVV